jgi:hypothetical protein
MVVDHVDSMEVVLWNGTLATASLTSLPDLYWALRGGGSVGRFALVTTFRYRLNPAPPVITVVDWEWPWLGNGEAIPFLQLWNWYAPSMDNRCSMSLSILGGSRPRFHFIGACVCDLETAQELLSPFLSNTTIWPSPTPSRSTIFATNWANATWYLDGCYTEERCLEEAHMEPKSDALGDKSNAWKEDCFYGYGQLGPYQWNRVLEITKRMCEGAKDYLCGTLMTPEGENGVQCTNTIDMAYPHKHRCSTFHVEFIAHFNTSFQEATNAQLERYRFAVQQLKNVDRDKFLLEPYSGYADHEFCEAYEEGGQWAMMMFAQNFTHVDRLCDVRCKYDPAQLSVTPCSFDFCYCDERHHVHTI